MLVVLVVVEALRYLNVGIQAERLAHALALLVAQSFRILRTRIAVLGVEDVVAIPGSEQQLQRAATVRVAPLAVRADLADARAGSERDRRGMRGMCRGVELELILGRGRAAEGANLAVRPRLLRNPIDGVVAVFARAREVLVFTAGPVTPALVLVNDGVAVLQQRGIELV